MDCPVCNTPMEEGFLQSGKTIYFSRILRGACTYCRPQKEDWKLTENWVGAILPAKYCPNCNHILLNLLPDPQEKKGK